MLEKETFLGGLLLSAGVLHMLGKILHRLFLLLNTSRHRVSNRNCLIARNLSGCETKASCSHGEGRTALDSSALSKTPELGDGKGGMRGEARQRGQQIAVIFGTAPSSGGSGSKVSNRAHPLCGNSSHQRGLQDSFSGVSHQTR